MCLGSNKCQQNQQSITNYTMKIRALKGQTKAAPKQQRRARRTQPKAALKQPSRVTPPPKDGGRATSAPPDPVIGITIYHVDEVIVSLPRVEFVLSELAVSFKDGCPVPGELKRTAKGCQCLAKLFRLPEHKMMAERAVHTFVNGINKVRLDEGARNDYAKRHMWNSQSPLPSINNPGKKQYRLPVFLPNSQPTSIILCRSIMIQLTQQLLLMQVKKGKEEMFPSLQSMKALNLKKDLFFLLRYLFTIPKDGRACWKQALVGSDMNLETAKSRVKRKELWHIAKDCIKCVDIEVHRQWLRDTFQGRVCKLPGVDIDAAFPPLVKRGNTLQSNHNVVSKVSLGAHEISTRPVMYRKIDVTTNHDIPSHHAIRDHLRPSIMASLTLDEEAYCAVDSAFLKSPSQHPQVPHYDLKKKDRENLKGRMSLGFAPLTDSGCYLQVWLPRKSENSPQHGVVLFIPKGCILLLPGDTIHGGGFLSDYQTQDLRLHFYIYTSEEAKEIVSNNNDYQSPKEYPNQKDLMPGGTVYELFNSDL